MGLFTNGTYIINPNNANKLFIDAIAKYNQKVGIKKITDATGTLLNIPENQTLSNLPSLIRRLSSTQTLPNTMHIQYRAFNSQALFGVFPRVIQQNTREVTEAGVHLEALISNTTNTRGVKVELDWLNLPLILTKKEARPLIQRYSSGAIEFPEINMFLFEYNGSCFFLIPSTPNDPGVTGTAGITLDINKGFLSTNPNEEDVEILTSLLQPHFETWKKNNYAGPLFPESKLNLPKKCLSFFPIPSAYNLYLGSSPYYPIPLFAPINKPMNESSNQDADKKLLHAEITEEPDSKSSATQNGIFATQENKLPKHIEANTSSCLLL